MDKKLDVKNLGQVFTPQGIVSDMLALIRNSGRVLEPSCGNGAFSDNIDKCVAIEYDKKIAPSYAQCMDFFDYPISEKFSTIIGNPPYVRFQDINEKTKTKLDMSIFDERSNLYLFFIYKCIQHLDKHGELIFIVPRDFLKATSAIKLNQYIYSKGTITDIINLGDQRVFKDACPNTIIFRFEKDNFSRQTTEKKTFNVINGQILFTANKYSIPFNDLFFVKVGAVSGADKYFVSDKGNLEFVCSSTYKTGKTKRMFYDINAPELKKYKDILINRHIKSFDESNWWTWGRKYYVSNDIRLYVNQKTRNENPFFYHKCKAYDGSILAIFPKFKISKDKIDELVNDFNNVAWDELGFICDGRFIFSQKSLENIVLPDFFNKYYGKL